MTTTPPLLAVENLSRRDGERGRWLLDDVSLHLAGGDRIALLGPTGSGKTLLLRALAWLDPIDSGTINWQGQSVSKQSVPAYRSRVIYLSQQPSLFAGTVENNLRFPYALDTWHGARFSRERIVAYLQSLDRDEAFLNQDTSDLSGGERQLVAMLRAVQLEPTILLLDEPTSALDPSATNSAERLIGEWQAGEPAHRAFLWVTHDARQAERVADRMLHLRNGQIEEAKE